MDDTSGLDINTVAKLLAGGVPPGQQPKDMDTIAKLLQGGGGDEQPTFTASDAMLHAWPTIKDWPVIGPLAGYGNYLWQKGQENSQYVREHPIDTSQPGWAKAYNPKPGEMRTGPSFTSQMPDPINYATNMVKGATEAGRIMTTPPPEVPSYVEVGSDGRAFVWREGKPVPWESVEPDKAHQWYDAMEQRGNLAPNLATMLLGGGAGFAERGGAGIAGGRLVQAGEHAAPLYSAVSKAIEGAPIKKAPFEQWTGWLKNQPGVKQEELNWLQRGGQPAAEAGAQLSKEEMQQWANANGVKLQEVHKEAPALSEEDEAEAGQQWINDRIANDRRVSMHEEGTPEFEQAWNDAYDDAMDRWTQYGRHQWEASQQEGGPKYGDYQMPGGGKNYREMLVTMPHEGGAKYQLVTDDLLTNGAPTILGRYSTWDEATRAAEGTYHNMSTKVTPEISFQSNHWDESNVLAHVRMNDRTMGETPISEIEAKIQKAMPDFKLEYAASGLPDHLVQTGVLTPQEAADWSRYQGFRNELARQRGTGARTLFLEELQSDWHQKGRKYGYNDPKSAAEELAKVEQQIKESDTLRAQHDANSARLAQEWLRTGDGATNDAYRQALHDYQMESDRGNQLYARRAELQRGWQSGGRVHRSDMPPDAPFKQTWSDLLLKRMVREAAEKGYDAIGWTPGDVQADRYDLSKKLKRLEYNPQSGHLVGHAPTAGPLTAPIVDQRGITPEKLPDYVGKDVAERLMQQKPLSVYSGYKVVRNGVDGRFFLDQDPSVENPYFSRGLQHGRYQLPTWAAGSWATKEEAERALAGLDKVAGEYGGYHRLEGNGLKVGGSGMRAFYDKMLVDKANALAKKYGGKVEQQPIEKPGPLYVSMKEVPFREMEGFDWEAFAGAEEGTKIRYVQTAGGDDVVQLLGRDGSIEQIDQNGHQENLPMSAVRQIREGPRKVHFLRITPELREQALKKGFPMFAAGAAAAGAAMSQPPQQVPANNNDDEAQRYSRALMGGGT